jgi:hypothetical protein
MRPVATSEITDTSRRMNVLTGKADVVAGVYVPYAG